MKLEDLKDKTGNVTVEVKIIWDQAQFKDMFGRKVKAVLVANTDSVKGDGSPTAYLDLYDADITKYKQGDNIKVIDGYAKLIQNNSGQFRITNAKKIEKI